MLTIFIGAYTLSSIGDAVAEMFGISKSGWARYVTAILVTLILDWCTIGITLYLNFLKTKQLAACNLVDYSFKEEAFSTSTNSN